MSPARDLPCGERLRQACEKEREGEHKSAVEDGPSHGLAHMAGATWLPAPHGWGHMVFLLPLV